MFKAKWIWDEEVPQSNSNKNVICYFRRKFYLPKGRYKFYIRVTADSRYKLYLNGNIIGFGPEKGDRWRYYYDVIEVKDYLQEGWNVISASVIHYYVAEPWIYNQGGPGSVFRTATAGFLLEGDIIDERGNLIEKICTDENWLVYRDKGVEFLPSKYMPLVGEVEVVRGELIPDNWRSVDFDDSLWGNAKIISKDRDLSFNPEVKLNELIPPWSLSERDIPLLYQEDKDFIRVISERGFISDVTLEPDTSYTFILDAGELTTGFPCLKVRGGKGSVVRLTYGECFSYRDSEGKLKKGVRDDLNGIIIGDTDTFYPSGREDYYEPFWFRTFRFVRVDVDVSSSPLTIERVWFRETGYPLNVEGNFSCSDERLNRVLDVSLRTLKRSMHETYEDCPYYEQMQYTMDAMLEALYTYQISKDYRLAKKAIYDFHSSLLPSGLLQSRYPSVAPQVIPLFSLYWIIMLRDYVLYSGEVDLIERYRPTIDAILGWFERHLTEENLVGKIGYWPYVDWVDGWDWGIPPSFNSDISTIYSLVYSYTLKVASYLMLISGSKGLFKEYKVRSMLIDKSIKKYCWDEEAGLFRDGPNTDEFSQHCQIWAVLNELVKSDRARGVIDRAINSAGISKASISYSYFLFRALDKVNLYNRYAPVLLDKWKKLLDLNVTTFPETFEDPRSECHGWSAVPLYESISCILGIRPGEPGFRRVDIKPHPIDLHWAQGTIPTWKGSITVRWEKDTDSILLNVSSPREMKIRLILSSMGLFKPALYINNREVTFRDLIELPGGDYQILLKEGADLR